MMTMMTQLPIDNNEKEVNNKKQPKKLEDKLAEFSEKAKAIIRNSELVKMLEANS